MSEDLLYVDPSLKVGRRKDLRPTIHNEDGTVSYFDVSRKVWVREYAHMVDPQSLHEFDWDDRHVVEYLAQTQKAELRRQIDYDAYSSPRL